MHSVLRFTPLEEELRRYYNETDPKTDYFKSELDALALRMKGSSAMAHKTECIRLLCEKSTVHVFRHFPFFHEMQAGRPRSHWGGNDAPASGGYLHATLGKPYTDTYFSKTEQDRKGGYLFAWNNPVGNDHHALDYDTLLQRGLGAIRKEAKALSEETAGEKKEFYTAVCSSVDSLLLLARRFSERAEEMLAKEEDPAARENLARIAHAARNVPEKPASSFYEAICSIVFCRECIGTVEGIGISTYGHVDRLLGRYYEEDLRQGRITRDGAYSLICALLIYTGVRFRENETWGETSTTVVLGGCDENGTPVYNEVTRLFLEAQLECKLINVKFDCRVCGQPRDYFKKIAAILLEGTMSCVFMNDKTHIAARVKHGQREEDARLYVAGGCHEIVSGGTEVCTRADTWISLPRILEDVLRRGAKEGFDDFDALCRAVVEEIHAYHHRIADLKNEAERHWSEFNPMPLYSALMRDCLEKGKDVTAGGARYSTTALSMVAPATLVDSLLAVKHLCFDTERLTLARFVEILDKNFEGEEELRQYILRKLPKMGKDGEANRFAGKLLHAISQIPPKANGRGGAYKPAFYAHNMYTHLGKALGATADGRKKGEPLSRGCSPSEFITGISPTDLIRFAENVDFTDYTDSFALECTLPTMENTEGNREVLAVLAEEFCALGGSTLQFNLLDRARLLDAREHPERNGDITVRVCGFSVRFVALDSEMQNEIISRTPRL